VYLFFDTETSGLPADWTAPASAVDNWPRLVQIAWISCDAEGRTTASHEYLIRPQGFEISRQATELHGISTARARREGVALSPVLVEFAAAVSEASTVVGHNLDFDVKGTRAEWIRAGMADSLADKPLCCTMKASTEYCQLPGRYGFKWPRLDELHAKLFREGFTDAHSALADTEACMRCFFRLRELGVVS
jgi:DNA polymerase III epsilon subunit-like protein